MIIIQIIFIILILIIFLIFNKTTKNEVLIIKSNTDKKDYLVNNYFDKQDAADLLGNIRNNILKLREYLVKNKKLYIKYNKYIDQLDNRLDNVIIKEKTEKNNFTSYSVNKGEEIIFCLRSKYNNKLHDLNLMMYVAIHEFAHVACPEIGHTELFKKIFKFFLEIAIIIEIYEYSDYSTDIKEYCGIYINESIV